MDDAFPKREVPTGRPRGHSLLSDMIAAERAANQAHETQDARHGDPPTASSGAGRQQSEHVTVRSSVPEAGTSGQAASSSSRAEPPKTKYIPPGMSRAIVLQTERHSTEDRIPNDFPPYDSSEQERINAKGDEIEALLRKWCPSEPPKKNFLETDEHITARGSLTRRSNKPELDVRLERTMGEYNGRTYLPLTKGNIRRLSPSWDTAELEPVGDPEIFKNIVITQAINTVHADHVIPVLERIGKHCDHLIVLSPVETSEVGSVFDWEEGDIPPGNDWFSLLKCFPHLKSLKYVLLVNASIDFSQDTYDLLRAAVSLWQAKRNSQLLAIDGQQVLHNGPALLTGPELLTGTDIVDDSDISAGTKLLTWHESDSTIALLAATTTDEAI